MIKIILCISILLQLVFIGILDYKARKKEKFYKSLMELKEYYDRRKL